MRTDSSKTTPPQNHTRRYRPACIWTRAGITAKKSCSHYQDCSTCRFDSAMDKTAAAGRHVKWQDAARKNHSTGRTCRHALTGRTPHRTCPMNYNCHRCAFDQMLEDTLAPGTGYKNLEMTDVKGFNIPADCSFHFGHTWARIDDGGFIRIGMDDFIFRVLGEPDRLDLPLIGNELNASRPGWGIRRTRNCADVLSPVNGIVTGVNTKAASRTDIAREHPYEDGWLFTVHHPDPKAALKDLIQNSDSMEWMNEEISSLEEMIETVAGPLAADGGLLSPDVYGNLPDLGWKNLTQTFLRT